MTTPDATVSYYKLQLALAQVAELKQALSGTLYMLEGYTLDRSALDQARFARALLAKLDKEAS